MAEDIKNELENEAAEALEDEMIDEILTEEENAAADEANEEPGSEEDEPKEEKSRFKNRKKKKSDTITLKRTEYDELKGNCDKYLDMAQRLQAEFTNFKKRNETLSADSYNQGIAAALIGIFPVVDNMERAIASLEDENDPHREGLEAITRQLKDFLAKLGVEEIPTEGAFDPNLHQAVMQCPAEDGKESGDIGLVLQKGYRIGEKVLRFAMVGVVE